MKKIIIVDDSDFIRRIVKMTLEKEGFEIMEESNGADGLITIKKNAPLDLIISDINMPEINGLDMVKQIKQDEALKSIPVILLTNESEEQFMDKKNEMKVEKWLAKPFQPNELTKIINEILIKKT